MQRQLEELLNREHFLLKGKNKMAFVAGPRQCGKTTLALTLQKKRGSDHLYRNWDDLAFRAEISKRPYGFIDAYTTIRARKPLAVLDEIHKFPRWKIYLKGLWDTRGEKNDILVTGSGRMDIYQKGGDSLLGRYHQYRLHPLSVSEATGKRFNPETHTPESILQSLIKNPTAANSQTREALDGLLRFGGFPEPFLDQSARKHRLWIRERRERLTREDLRDMTRIQMIASLEQMAELLILRAGSLLSLNNLREDLGVSLDSVRLWMEQLERLYFCYRIRPYAGKLARSLRREPKLYLYDWSELQDEGARFENLIASALLRWVHFAEDWGQTALGLHFIRDKEKREVDFLLTLDKKPALLIEAKRADVNPGPPLRYFSEKLGNIPRMVVVEKATEPGTSNGALILPAASFLAQIP